MKISAYSFILTLLFYSSSFAQQYSLKGIVNDAETEKGIPFASINILGNHKGTVTNTDGEFSIRSSDSTAILIFSHLGYKDDTVSISSKSINKVTLEKETLLLNEIVYEGDDYVTFILKKVYYKFLDEYDRIMYSDAFYRQSTQINGEITEIQETIYAAKINDAGVVGTSLINGRYAASKDALVKFNNFSIYFKMFVLSNGIDNQEVTLIHPNSKEKYDWTVEGYFPYAKKEIVILNFVSKKGKCETPGEGQLYVDTDDFSVKKFIYHAYGPLGNEVSAHPFIKYEDNNYHFTWDMNFHQFNDQHVIEYIKVDLSLDLDSKKSQNKVMANSLAYFYNYKKDSADFVYEGANPKIKDRDAIKKIPYDPSFWEENAIVSRTSFENEMIENFNEKGAFGTLIDSKKKRR